MSAGKILIVDDEPESRSLLRAVLGAQGYEVADCRSGEEALLRSRMEVPDLILIAQDARWQGDFAMCHALRLLSDTPVIILSAGPPDDVVAALDAGADDFIQQPFRTEELLARIRAVIRRKLAADSSFPPRLRLDGVEVDFATRQITARGQTRHLTPKEFELLKFLVCNAGKVVSHRKILQAIWGPQYDGQVDYLRVFINQLRKKIETDPSNPKFIVTEPWVGYRFVMPDTFLNAKAS